MPLVGKCNQCGLCCYVKDERTGEMLKCMNLMVFPGKKPGEPYATFCSAYKVRTKDMLVYLVDNKNRLRGETLCGGDGSVEEMDDLIYKNLVNTERCTLKLED